MCPYTPRLTWYAKIMKVTHHDFYIRVGSVYSTEKHLQDGWVEVDLCLKLNKGWNTELLMFHTDNVLMNFMISL